MIGDRYDGEFDFNGVFDAEVEDALGNERQPVRRSYEDGGGSEGVGVRIT